MIFFFQTIHSYIAPFSFDLLQDFHNSDFDFYNSTKDDNEDGLSNLNLSSPYLEYDKFTNLINSSSVKSPSTC